MKKTFLFLLFLGLISAPTFAQTPSKEQEILKYKNKMQDLETQSKNQEQHTQILSDIKKYYFIPVFEQYDVEMMKKGFDESFFFASVKDQKIEKVSLNEFMQRIAKRKENPPKDKWDYEMRVLDMTENQVATAKILLFRDGKHIFTDYLTLLKVENQWKITAKVFFRHDK